MGLVTAMLVAPMLGHYITFMTPAAFVRRPGRWIREMARKPDDTGGVISVAPELRVRSCGRPRPAQGRRGAAGSVQRQGGAQRQRTDLGGHRAPVQRGLRPASDFNRRRSSRPTAWPRRRCSCPPPLMGEPPRIISVDRDELNTGTVSSRFPKMRRSAVAQASGGQGRRRRVGRHRRRRVGQRVPRRADRRDLDQRPEHGHRLLGQA